MAQIQENVHRIAEFNALFMTLNEKGKDAALTVLKSLNFAQTVMYSEMTQNTDKNKVSESA